MSWQPYVDRLVGNGACQQAAILGHDGNIWATTPGCGIKIDEGKSLVGGFANPKFFEVQGPYVAGKMYIYLGCDGRTLRAKAGTKGIHVVKTAKTILVAVYDQPILPGQCSGKSGS
jgi:profilin